MQKLSKIHLSLIGALALIGCDNVGGTGENSQVRQNKLTISNTPVFPHSGNGDVYALVLSNHTKEDMQLTNSQLKGISPSNEDSADDISSKLQLAKSLKATQLTDLIDLSACQTIKAGANCIVTIQLPKQVASGYIDFSLQYTDSKSKPYTVDKLIVFNAEMLAKDGVVLTNQYIESIVVNSDKYTLAIPFQLTDDFESVAIRQHGVAPTGYNQIICNNQANDDKINTSGKYARNNSCTALIELDGHEANPELGLATSDASGLERFIEIKSSVLYGNYPELIALGAPVILRTASTQPIYIKNIGTQAAKDIQLAEAGDTASFTVSKTQCAGKTLENNQQCFVQYQQAKGSNQTASITQTVSYKGDDGLDTRMFSIKYPVYINKVAPLKRPDQRNTTVLPAHRAIDAQKEYFPEELENITVTFDQPINASGLYQFPGGMGTTLSQGYSGCEGYTYLAPGTIICKVSAWNLNLMFGDTPFEIRTSQLGNSAGLIANATSAHIYNYVVRHHRNPRVSAITNTSQTFKPGDTIRLRIDLNTSQYSANSRYRFNPQSGYTITSNNCNTSTNGCRIEVEYKIPDANQLPPGSGTISYTLPPHILSIIPASGSKPTELQVRNNNLTVSVTKLPAIHIAVNPTVEYWFSQGMFCSKPYNLPGARSCSIRHIEFYEGILAIYPKHVLVVRSYNRFNGRSSALGFFSTNLSLNNKPSQSQGEIDPGVWTGNNIITHKNGNWAGPLSTFYVLLIPEGEDITTNPPGTVYIGRYCIPRFPTSSSSTGANADAPYCKHLPPGQ